MTEHMTQDTPLELISSDRCPFVQRSIITLEHKSVPYTVTYIDPYDPPEWFSALSPLGKVPVLKLGEHDALFESAVINEYLDEITPGNMHPQDPLEKAKNRAWIEFGAGCLSNTFNIMAVQTETEYNAVKQELRGALERLEGVCDANGPYFNGSQFCLIDTAYAPLFIRLSMLGDMTGLSLLGGLPTVSRWQAALLALPEVNKSRAPNLQTRFIELMQQKNAWGLSKVKPEYLN